MSLTLLQTTRLSGVVPKGQKGITYEKLLGDVVSFNRKLHSTVACTLVILNLLQCINSRVTKNV